MLPSSVFAWVLLLWRVVESREFLMWHGRCLDLMESKGEINLRRQRYDENWRPAYRR
jgi:hypothetical protein